MKHFLVAFLILGTIAIAEASDGWSRLGDFDDKVDISVSRIVLRPDSEDETIFWLEFELPTLRDPGDGYLLTLGKTSYSEFKWRGPASDEKGCKWALRFSDLDSARSCFQKAGDLHHLKKSAMIDKTKG